MKLTEEQIELIRQSWKDLIKIGMAELGLKVFFKLFTETPFLRTLFYKLELPPNENFTLLALRENSTMKTHAFRVMVSISKFVKYLDNPEELKALTEELGKIHSSHKVDPEYFEYLAPVMLEVIQEELNIPSKSPIVQIWIKAYGILRNGITGAM